MDNITIKKLQKPDYISDNWVNEDTWDFISNLSFDGYILAGHSVTNMIEKIPLQGDLDFWVEFDENYLNAFDEMAKYYKNFNLYPSMIEMYNDDNILPRINLIYTSLDTKKLLNKFDLPYCRCYWIPKINYNKIANDRTLTSIKTKLIPLTGINIYDIKNKRIVKALKYGYTFDNFFWYHFDNLISNPDKKQYKKPTKLEYYHIELEDLEPNEFKLDEIGIIPSDIKNVNLTLSEIANQYQKIALTPKTKLPILLKFTNEDIILLKKYIESIVLQNSLSDVNYLEIQIGGLRFSINKNNLHSEKHIKENNIKCKVSSDYEEDDKDDDKDDDEEDEDDEPPKKTNILKKNIKCEVHFDEEDDKPPKKTNILKKNIKCEVHSDEEDDKSSILKKTNIFKKNILPNKEFQKAIQLNESGSSYILIDFISDNLQLINTELFGSMWDLHPEQKHKIIMYEKEVEVNRYSKSYLNTWTDLTHTKSSSYMYSGYDTLSNNDKLPEIFKPYYEFMKNIDNKYNQIIVNWYENENDYIAPHADCQKGMIENSKIAILTLNECFIENIRYLEITPKYKKYQYDNEPLANMFKIKLDHGSIITMCGTIQDNFLHEIKKENKKIGKRISLSFRQMKMNNI